MTKMNKFKLLILILIGNVFYITNIYILNTKVKTLTYKNNKLNLMVEDVINYSDFTADTGEFDEFIASSQGERFFDNYRKIYDK